jgi:SAM-dependent methyltransferase
MASRVPHSAHVLTDLRDSWWTGDHLDLLARRFDLAAVRGLLDVGCGLGHWARRWLPRLAPDATVVGVDFEARWTQGAAERLPTARFVRAHAAALPFADASFDAATCQTVLMHVAAPERVLAEMVRVVRPGGLVYCAEPNQMVNLLFWSDRMVARPPEAVAAVTELWLRVIHGKRALGDGDSLMGERLPGLFADAGLEDIALFQTERMLPFLPPYGPVQREVLDTMARHRAAGTGSWDATLLRRRHRAGGGTDDAFDRGFALISAWAEEDEGDAAAGRFRSAGGGSLYVAAGRKRS